MRIAYVSTRRDKLKTRVQPEAAFRADGAIGDAGQLGFVLHLRKQNARTRQDRPMSRGR